MTVLWHALIITLTIVALWRGALWTVEAAARMARRVGMPELVVGLTVVALGTSLPEFAVSVSSALEGKADIAMGNVIGSNIFNLGLILGGVALVRAVATSRRMVFRDGVMLVFTALILIFFLRDMNLARMEGLILLGVLAAYLVYLIRQRQPAEEDVPSGQFERMDLLRLPAGLMLVLVGAHFLVDSASTLALMAGVSEWLIGITIVAIGTSAPELATSFAALVRNLHGISAGNLIGSDLFNLLGVLGLAALVQPFSIGTDAQQSLPLLLGMAAVLLILMRSGWRLSQREGGLLILLGITRWVMNVGG